jgi:uncharacterized protein (DUF3084 family)
MMQTISDNASQIIGTASVAIIAIFVGAQKLLKDWRSTNAETSIITLMHTELERLSEQNAQLSTELGRLHTEVINLNRELQKLTAENQRLQAEVIALTSQISKLGKLTQKESAWQDPD